MKWTENPSLQDARHLLTFLGEHAKQASHGYVICRCRHPLRLLMSERVLGTTAEMWVTMQAAYDLWLARQKRKAA